MSLEEKMSLVERLFISYPRLDEVMKRISHCHKFSKISAEPECMLIKGDTGAGKTTLYKRYERKFPRYETDEGTVVPVLSTTIPVPATVKSLATKLLLKLGDPMAERGSVVYQTLRIQRLLKACGVELIILDEFQHFIDRDSKKVLETVSDWLKDLLNETRIPIVLIGLPYSDHVLETNKQLSRRFSMRTILDPFGWGTLKQRSDFRKFLNAVDNKLPFSKRSNLADEEMAFRFFCASDGVVANVMQVARRASSLAIERSMKSLDLSVLSEAYEERLAARNPKRENPFLE
jgi:hypothetical protein